MRSRVTVAMKISSLSAAALTSFAISRIVELPNGDYAHTIVRNFLFTAFQRELWVALGASADPRLAEIADKCLKETQYHVQHASDWTIRLGDGTEQSHARMQRALDVLWPYTAEFFSGSASGNDAEICPAWSTLEAGWHRAVRPVLDVATLERSRAWLVFVAWQRRRAQRAPARFARRDAISAAHLSELQLVMTPRYHPLRIAEVRPETPDCISVKFDLPP